MMNLLRQALADSLIYFGMRFALWIMPKNGKEYPIWVFGVRDIYRELVGYRHKCPRCGGKNISGGYVSCNDCSKEWHPDEEAIHEGAIR
jgi:tRNA(Ile2) C34 agmatinyltransferase TiaS